ncbi:MAG TPA: ring-cleaving dioxygenase [Thermomicrobiales bacterium]|nr:ring-cleaving dioxygenase [Thermomicrobiales bacterium]
MEPRLTGIHHVTMIASDPQRNLDFYTNLLGLRLVKLTVNFDAPNVYHFYYGDGLGSPGTILTFFPFPGARGGRQGAGQTATTALAIAPASLGYWVDRLLAARITYDGPTVRGETRVLSFKDPDGLALELVTDANAVLQAPWERGPVPAEHQIRGVAGVTLWEDPAEPTREFLTDVLGFEAGGTHDDVQRFLSNGQFADVRSVRGFWSGVVSAGTVHHVAWRTADDEQQLAWRKKLTTFAPDVTMVQDRQYFNSIYFREPGGVLFEIATDTPGFTIDEAPDELGTSLKLPPRYEAQRALIEDTLPKIVLPEGVRA